MGLTLGLAFVAVQRASALSVRLAVRIDCFVNGVTTATSDRMPYSRFRWCVRGIVSNDN